MLSPLRNRFGIPGVISVIALVFAMLGGAYADSDNGGGKATASAKAKKGPRGPKGPAGPAGPAGSAGPQGPAGANGKDGSSGLDGENGKDGKDGKPGKDGTSVTNTQFAGAGGPCTEGGSKLVGTATTYACNGVEGSPWTAGGTLPPGETETGAYWFESPSGEGSLGAGTVGVETVSFSIRLASTLNEANTIFMTQGGPSNLNCTGNVDNPTAAPGFLCVYDEGMSNITEAYMEGARTVGARVFFVPNAAPAFGGGTWAVTAPTVP